VSERLQKFMAQAGIGSRRHCETLIQAGRVSINGATAELGVSVDPLADRVLLDGKPIRAREKLLYLMLNKPTGVLSSTKSQGEFPTVLDMLRIEERIYPVGRLDVDSQGLVLLTNDGELTYHLTHPKYETEKEYRVQLNRVPAVRDLDVWRGGLYVPGLGRTSPAEVKVDSVDDKPWIRVVMHEGKNREIRRVADTLGYQVRRLIRVRIGTLRLGGLPEGSWRHLMREEVSALQEGGSSIPSRPKSRVARSTRERGEPGSGP
jgi:23S rRNA pseudouridine2605 synthase